MGFKTICSGSINMAAAMQRTMDLDLELYSEGSSKDGKEGKESGSNAPSGTGGGSGGGAGEKVSGGGGGGGGGGGILMAKVTVQSLTSQPVDHEEATERLKALSGLGDGAGKIKKTDPPSSLFTVFPFPRVVGGISRDRNLLIAGKDLFPLGNPSFI